ncbi:MAG: Hpt domain-containing protein [Sphingobacteriaceae bacterium]
MAKLKPGSADSPEISLAYLHDIADGSNEFMVEMIDIFLHQTPGYLNQIETAIQHKDWVTVAEIAHKLRPTFAFIGVQEAIDAMATMEKYARSGMHLDQISVVFNEFKPLTDGLFSKLKEIRNGLAG